MAVEPVRVDVGSAGEIAPRCALGDDGEVGDEMLLAGDVPVVVPPGGRPGILWLVASAAILAVAAGLAWVVGRERDLAWLAPVALVAAVALELGAVWMAVERDDRWKEDLEAWGVEAGNAATEHWALAWRTVPLTVGDRDGEDHVAVRGRAEVDSRLVDCEVTAGPDGVLSVSCDGEEPDLREETAIS